MERSIECEIYQSELRKLRRGVPLYDPKPPGGYHVHIGDVGHIQNGQFQSVFNAFSDSDETQALNRDNCTPEGFYRMSPEYTTTIEGTRVVAGSVFKTIDSQSLESDIGLKLWSSAPASAGVQLSLSHTKECGALLSIRHSALSTSARSRWNFKLYMLTHYKSWFSFIRIGWAGTSGCRTSCLLQTANSLQTGLQVFLTQSASREEARLSLMETFRASFSTARRTSVNIPIRYGPDPDTTLALLQNRNRIRNEVALVGENEVHRDQCILSNAFWVKERPLLGIKMKAAAEPKTLDMDRDADSLPKVLSTDSWLDSDEDEDKYKEEPHEFALNTILEHSNADVAIVHESDVYALAEAIGYRFVRPLDLSQLRYEGAEVNVVTEHDPSWGKIVGSLKHKDSDLDAEPEERPSMDDIVIHLKGLSQEERALLAEDPTASEKLPTAKKSGLFSRFLG